MSQQALTGRFQLHPLLKLALGFGAVAAPMVAFPASGQAPQTPATVSTQTLGPTGVPAGFTRIFNGRDTKGWHWSLTNHHGNTGQASVVDGELHLAQKDYGQGGLFITDKTYKNFDLYWEVNMPFSTNSGVFVRSTESGSAYQIELLPVTGSARLITELMPLTTPATVLVPNIDALWRAGEWNSVRVRFVGDAPKIECWLNGVKVWEAQEAVNDKINGEVSGHIGLQLHWSAVYEAAIAGNGNSNSFKPGNPVRYRNIAIKVLP